MSGAHRHHLHHSLLAKRFNDNATQDALAFCGAEKNIRLQENSSCVNASAVDEERTKHGHVRLDFHKKEKSVKTGGTKQDEHAHASSRHRAPFTQI